MNPICAACGRCLDHLGQGRYQCLLCELAARELELAEAVRLLRRAEDEVPVGMPTFTAIQKFLTRHQARKETT